MGNVETSVQERNKSLVSDRFEAWAQGNGSPFDLLADDASWTIEGGSVASKTYVGRETFIREVIRPFNRPKAAMSPAHTASSAWSNKHAAICALNWPVT